MNETFEQMALRVAQEIPICLDPEDEGQVWCVTFAKSIRDELCKEQEPGTQVMGTNSLGDCVISGGLPTGTALYLHPATIPAVYQCPRCATSMEVDPTAKPAVKSIPSDMILVPREPTKEMKSTQWASNPLTARDCYKAMIAAYEKEQK